MRYTWPTSKVSYRWLVRSPVTVGGLVPYASGDAGRRRSGGFSQKGSTLDLTTRTVVHRFETYAYTGPREALTNEALCADLSCTAPSAGELGHLISVAKAGSSCGNQCVASYTAGSAVTLTAKATAAAALPAGQGPAPAPR